VIKLADHPLAPAREEGYYHRKKKRPPPATTWTSVCCGCLPFLGISQSPAWLRAKVGNRNTPMSRWLKGGGMFYLSMIVQLWRLMLVWSGNPQSTQNFPLRKFSEANYPRYKLAPAKYVNVLGSCTNKLDSVVILWWSYPSFRWPFPIFIIYT